MWCQTNRQSFMFMIIKAIADFFLCQARKVALAYIGSTLSMYKCIIAVTDRFKTLVTDTLLFKFIKYDI
jgi:hypothetical protein